MLPLDYLIIFLLGFGAGILGYWLTDFAKRYKRQ